jgi:excinuclease UvrABC nuclease subunit
VALASAIDRLRDEPTGSDADRIEEVRQRKEHAIEANDFETAHRLRNRERELIRRTRRGQAATRDAIRERLGLPSPSGAG